MRNDLTLALILDSTWKSSYTYLFLRYYQRIVNPTGKVITCPDIDTAIKECSTDMLLTFKAGALPFCTDFFNELLNAEAVVSDEAMLVGEIRLGHDYAYLDDSILLLNLKIWKQNGSPKFKSNIKHGPIFYTSVAGDHRDTPLQIVKSGDDTTFIDQKCSSSGAEMIAVELQRRGMVESVAQHVGKQTYFYLSSASPYEELISETTYEKKYLAQLRSRISAIDTDDLSSAKQTTAGIVVAPATGLKAITLAEHFRAKTVVIYSHDAGALELQKLIFAAERKTLYGDIIEQFKEDTGREPAAGPRGVPGGAGSL